MSILRRAGPVRQRGGATIADVFEGGVQGIEFVRGIRAAERDRESEQRLRDIQERRVGVQERTVGVSEREQALEHQRLRQQQQVQSMVGEIVQGPERTQALEQAEQHRQRAGGLKLMKDIADLSQVPKSVRGPQVDTFAARFEQQTGHALAPNVVETLKKGSTDDLKLVSRSLARRATSDSDFGARQAIEVLQDPGKSATMLTEAGKEAGRLQESDGLAARGGQPSQGEEPRREQAPEQRAQPETPQPDLSAINRRVQQLQTLQARFPEDTPARQTIDSGLAVMENRRKRAIDNVEANVRRQIMDMAPEQQLRTLREFEAQAIENGASSDRIERIRDDIERAEEGQGIRAVNPKNEFVRMGLTLFPEQFAEDGSFTGTAEQAQTIRDEIRAERDREIRLEARSEAGAEREAEANREISPREARALNLPIEGPRPTVNDLAEQGIAMPRAKDMEEILEQEAATRQSLEKIGDIIELVRGRPEIMGVSSSLVRFTRGIVAQGKGMVRLFNQNAFMDGEQVPMSSLEDPANYEGTWAELGIDNANLQSMMTNLAFSVAQTRVQRGGRITNQQIERALVEIGGAVNPQNPNTLVGAIRSVGYRMDRDYRQRVEAITGRDPGSFIRGDKPISEMDADELNDLVPTLLPDSSLAEAAARRDELSQ